MSRIHGMLTADWDWTGRTSQPAVATASIRGMHAPAPAPALAPVSALAPTGAYTGTTPAFETVVSNHHLITFDSRRVGTVVPPFPPSLPFPPPFACPHTQITQI